MNRREKKIDDSVNEFSAPAFFAKTHPTLPRQTATREAADEEGFVEPHLWTGIGRTRSGCGGAIVGDPDQILAKIQRYMDMGMRSFIFSGYPHLDECRLFANYVLPRIPSFSMPEAQNRRPTVVPPSPLGAGVHR